MCPPPPPPCTCHPCLHPPPLDPTHGRNEGSNQLLLYGQAIAHTTSTLQNCDLVLQIIIRHATSVRQEA